MAPTGSALLITLNALTERLISLAVIRGIWWSLPQKDLTKATEIWLTEGIFDAISLAQNEPIHCFPNELPQII